MTNFFTPIQISSPEKLVYEPYSVQKYNDDPFQLATGPVESLNDHRRKIIQWLKSMPLINRTTTLAYTNKQFSSLFMSMLQSLKEDNKSAMEFSIKHLPSKGYHLVKNTYPGFIDPLILEAEKELFGCLVVMSKFSMFDTITINVDLIDNITRLYEIFEIIENGISHELSTETFDQYEHENSSMFFHHPQEQEGTYKSASSWIVEVLKKNISFKFFKDQKEKKGINCEKFSILYDMKDKSKKMGRFWKSVPKQGREHILHKCLSADIRVLVNDYRHMILLDDESFPKIQYSHPNHVEEFKKMLIQCNGSKIFDILSLTNIYDALFSLSVYKYEILLQIQEGVQKTEALQLCTMKKKKNISIIKPKTKTITVIGQKKETNPNQKQPMQKKQQPISENPVKRKKKSSKKKAKQMIEFVELCNQLSQTTVDPEEDEDNDSVQQKSDLQNVSVKVIDKIYNRLSEKSATYDKYRKIGVNRIGYILEKLHLSFQVYGSYACGVTTPESDVDICIDPTIVHFFYASFSSYRQKIHMSLEFLRHAFEQYPWTKNFTLITTATVPILMFEIVVSVPFELIPKDKNYNIPRLHGRTNPVSILVDFTIEPFVNMVKEIVPHLGQQSTMMVREWLFAFPFMRQTLVLLKYLLQIHGFHKSYTGGISSFAFAIIVASSFMSQERHPTLFSALTHTCQFIASFPETKLLIDIRCREKVIHEHQGLKLVVVNPFNGKNLTENCQKFNQIKTLFDQFQQQLPFKRKTPSESEKKYERTLKDFFNFQ